MEKGNHVLDREIGIFYKTFLCIYNIHSILSIQISKKTDFPILLWNAVTKPYYIRVSMHRHMKSEIYVSRFTD